MGNTSTPSKPAGDSVQRLVRHCVSAGCLKKSHPATWVMFADWCPMPVCDRVKAILQTPPEGDLPDSDFTPLTNLTTNSKMDNNDTWESAKGGLTPEAKSKTSKGATVNAITNNPNTECCGQST